MLSLVVPCFNEEDNVEKFYSQTVMAFENNIDEYEFVFVDDGSSDKTLERLHSLFDKYGQRVQVLSFSRNFGKEAAIYAGLKNARGDFACIIDADLQQRPEVVVEMMNIIKEDNTVDCVTAYQAERKENKLMSAFKSSFYKMINRMSEVDFVNGASDFRLMNRKMLDAVISMGEYHRFSKGIFGFVGFNTKFIPYKVQERENGTSKWNFFKLLKYAVEGIISFSSFPLKLSAYVGFFSAFVSVIYLVLVIIKRLAYGVDVPGYASIVVLVLFLGGLQLMSLGILGEYMSKVYDQVKNRPIYILKEHLKDEENVQDD
ncbi:glycosyltransferase family 2 protein [Eubacterium coprostanoligenes]|uniref:glycosyltransferase family 2 protein n=1 Tax=Eubacterium coprostanoligenes TaxID=290054 RepID=UPI0023524B14|nr:glycosyltransferase family 2 protein [Eubacterium coprostanoligenes]MCI6254793.1 glycosyltransferase family 2 protein [Eubacterium coprostanoligenes]MDY5400355.1 glycosyltransferase family 2 protein [Eubacterium coprostanoligenes]